MLRPESGSSPSSDAGRPGAGEPGDSASATGSPEMSEIAQFPSKLTDTQSGDTIDARLLERSEQYAYAVETDSPQQSLDRAARATLLEGPDARTG
jgi:hypothetical protein